MAEGRMLKNKISTDVDVADLSNDTHRILFTWGISHLDIEGRITGEPREFKAKVAPLLDHVTRDIVLDFFQDAVKMGLIERYSVHNKWVVQYPGFKKNQTLRADKEAPSTLPSNPDNSGTTPGLVQDNSGTTPDEVKRSKVKRSKKTDLPDSRSGDSLQKLNGRDFEVEFKAFYAAYPNKKNPAYARKAFLSVAKKGKLPPYETLMAALEDQKTWPEWNREAGKFIPYPASWLNGERWKDERTGPPGATRRNYASNPNREVIENG